MTSADWFEVLGQDPTALKAFYAKVFGWEFEETPGTGYAVVKGHKGGIGKAPQGPGWSGFYMKVENVDGSLETAVSAGGKVLMPGMNLPDGMRVGVFADPEGHAIGVVGPIAYKG